MIEILLSTYNGEKFLAEQLDSLLGQTVKDIRIRIRDDGSTDRTLDIAHMYKSKFPGVVNVGSGPNIGYTRSFLTLLKSAPDAEYYAFCDQDDVWRPDKLERAVRGLAAISDQPALYASSFERVDAQLNHIDVSKPPLEVSFRAALVESLAYGCTMVMNRRARDLIVVEGSTQVAITHDWWCYLVVTALGRVVFDPIPSLKYRQHSQNLLGAPPGFLHSWRNRFRRLKNRKQFTPWHRQAIGFAALYETQLSHDKLETLNLINEGRTNAFARLKLTFSNHIFREKKLDDLVLRILILFGAFSS